MERSTTSPIPRASSAGRAPRSWRWWWCRVAGQVAQGATEICCWFCAAIAALTDAIVRPKPWSLAGSRTTRMATRCEQQLCLAHAVQTLDFRHHIAVSRSPAMSSREVSDPAWKKSSGSCSWTCPRARPGPERPEAGRAARGREGGLHVHLRQIGLVRSKGDGQRA